MKKKKLLSMILMAALAVSMLAGCSHGPEVAAESQTPPEDVTAAPETAPEAGGAVKTGLCVMVDLSGSTSAGAEIGGAKSDITLVAVTVDENGVIDDCVIDMIGGSVQFDSSGKIITPLDTTFPSKNELGEDYGMKKASGIGKEWNEQAQALADYVTGKTLEEVKGIAMDETTLPTEADLAASVTLHIGGFIAGVESAVNSAQALGAQKGDTLYLTSTANMAKSKDAGEEDGTAQNYATIAALTMRDDIITSCYIDAVQANVSFDAKGQITSDLTAPVQTKNQLGDSYGMKAASSIGKEWYEQAAAFAAYVTGKTRAEVAAIALSEGKPAEADLAASVTLGIGDFMVLVEKAG